ncbi:MAG TPA: 2-oxo acid dehydrogenase subunit E2, partial [Bacteroidales bacterium]|nr:2-oxo acid dehydrogenase subunit E2 [Bacteroidales bacterium]
MQTHTDYNSTWRKVASSIYRKPVDSKILGFVELDITGLEDYIKRKRAEGLKITLTHIFTLAVARALAAEVPELNTYVRRGNIIHREHIDAMVSILLKEQQMGTIHVPDADKLTLKEVSLYMHDQIKKSRKGDENKTMRLKGLVASIPWPFRNWLYKLLKRITIDWGFSLPSIGLGVNSFGSFMVTNIGSIGLDMGFP